jgi:hypothetical protein
MIRQRHGVVANMVDFVISCLGNIHGKWAARLPCQNPSISKLFLRNGGVLKSSQIRIPAPLPVCIWNNPTTALLRGTQSGGRPRQPCELAF